MKSTKYKLLQDDLNHACEQLRINKKIIDELREENERYKRMYENTGAIFNRQNMKRQIEELTSLNLWSARRLSQQQYKDFSYDELEKLQVRNTKEFNAQFA